MAVLSNAFLTSFANVLTTSSKQGAGSRVMNWMTGSKLSVKSDITLGFQTVIDTASKAGDADTADLFTEVSRGIDKLLWLVEAHAQAND